MIPDLSKLKDYEYPKIAERFYRETAHHELTVFHDDGLYRHLRMMPPKSKSSAYWYDIITWPGNLVFRGDGESFAFARAEDMFEFFRSGLHKDGSLHINASYWAEKLTSNRECAKTYDEKRFEEFVAEVLAEHEEEHPGLTDAWNKATGSFYADYDTSYEAGAWDALEHFEYGPWYFGTCSCGAATGPEEHRYDVRDWARKNGHHLSNGKNAPGHTVEVTSKDSFTFGIDLGDVQFRDYDWWFLWSLYGILRAISAYDRSKGKGAAVEVSLAPEAKVV